MSYLNKKIGDRLFIELCETYHEKILKYLYYSVKDIEDAKDLVQDVFTIVYNRIDELERHENKAGFIYQTAKYTAANFKRKASKKSLVEHALDVEMATEFADIYDELESIYDKKIDEDTYRDDVFLSLSKDKQKLYKMHYVEEKSYREIAENLGITEVNLRMKYVRLRREIKQIIKHIAKENF